MTNNNLYELPKTETISYYDAETGKNLTAEEYQQLYPANSGEITIINKSGSNFTSEKEGYGPCNGSFCPHSSSFYLKFELDKEFPVEYSFVTKDETYTTESGGGWTYIDQWAGFFRARYKFWWTKYLVIRNEDVARNLLSGLQGSGENGVYVFGVDYWGTPQTPPGSSVFGPDYSDCDKRRKNAKTILENAIKKHLRGEKIDETHNF